ncbi:MAG: PmoA family protein, partial [Verrucomicrobiales bacterium]|nr:PmoA family protein [Verrucomicrobiales bacterium]
TPAGQSPEDLYITRLPWADLSRLFPSTTTNPGGNPAPSRTSGAALFIAPDHPDYPPTWLTRHYGVLCIGWPGVDGRTFAPGVPIRCAYRVWIHRHGTAPDKVAAAYESYRAEHTKK